MPIRHEAGCACSSVAQIAAWRPTAVPVTSLSLFSKGPKALTCAIVLYLVSSVGVEGDAQLMLPYTMPDEISMARKS